jgi:hypothetical protein
LDVALIVVSKAAPISNSKLMVAMGEVEQIFSGFYSMSKHVPVFDEAASKHIAPTRLARSHFSKHVFTAAACAFPVPDTIFGTCKLTDWFRLLQ